MLLGVESFATHVTFWFAVVATTIIVALLRFHVLGATSPTSQLGVEFCG